jgi:hypothetical protein
MDQFDIAARHRTCKSLSHKAGETGGWALRAIASPRGFATEETDGDAVDPHDAEPR